jgi:hypothetical protein
MWTMMVALATLGLGVSACVGTTPEPATTEVPTRPRVAEPATPAALPVAPVSSGEATEAVEAEPEAETTPATVFAAHVDDERRRWATDMVDFTGIDVGPLEQRLAVLAESEGGPELELAAGDPLLPPGFAVGDPWTLVTRAGAEHRVATGFDAMVMGGSGDMHFSVHLGAARKRARGPAIALRGHVLTKESKLVTPAVVKASTLGPDMLDRLVAALEPHIEPEVREANPDLVIRERHVKLYPGRFPGGRTHVAFVHAERQGEELPVPISGVLFVAADGSAEFFANAVIWGSAKLLGLLDVNGDGIDEVFYEDRYFEGWYLEMIQWDGDQPRGRTVTGDGV